MEPLKPNSLRVPDDDIVRIYKENKHQDWAKQIKFLARLNGASEMDIVSILERRSSDLGAAARPVRTSASDYGLIMPTPAPKAFEQVVLRRINTAKEKVSSAIKEMNSVLRMLEVLEDGVKENGAQNRAYRR